MRKFESNSPKAVWINCDKFGWNKPGDVDKKSVKNVKNLQQ